MANYIKKELETFEFDKREYTSRTREHLWCAFRDDKRYQKFLDKKEELHEPKFSRVQSDPDIIGQYSDYNK